MITKKIIIGGFVAGVIYFLLGWLMYGKFLRDFFHQNATVQVDRPDDQIIFWALIAGNLLMGLLIAFIVVKTNSTSFSSGMATGIVVGLLMSAGFDLVMYGTANILNLNAVGADIATATIITAIAGGVVGAISGARVGTTS